MFVILDKNNIYKCSGFTENIDFVTGTLVEGDTYYWKNKDLVLKIMSQVRQDETKPVVLD